MDTKLLNTLLKKLSKIEAALDKCRGSVLEDGWQTMRYAKKMRKWDYYAQEKMNILQQVEDLSVQSRKECPVKLVCQCPSDKNWNGICKLIK